MKKKVSLLFLIAIFLMLIMPAKAYADAYLSDKTETVYDSSNGLQTSKANAICQTEDGFIWIGQYSGLTSYDSRAFTTYTKYEDLDLTGVVSLASYKDILYIGTQKCIIEYQKETGFSKIDLNLNVDFCVQDIEIMNDTVIFATDKGLYQYNIIEENNTHKIRQLDNKNVIAIASNNKDTFYYVASNNIVYDKNGNEYYKGSQIRSIYYNSDTVFMGTNDGKLHIKMGNTVYIHQITVADKAINKMTIDGNKLFLGSDEGLHVFNLNNITKEDSKPENISNLKIKSLIQDLIFDYQGNLWLVSSDYGVSKITQNELVDYFYEYNIEARNINSIIKYKGLTYIASEDGLLIVDEVNNKEIKENNLINLIGKSRIRDLEIFNDKLYIATYSVTTLGLVEYDGENINVIDYSMLCEENEKTLSATNVRCLDVMGDYLLIGTNYGIAKMNKNGVITAKKLEHRPLYIYHINDMIYLCLENSGLNKIDSNFSLITPLDNSKIYSTLKCLYHNGKMIFNDNNILYYIENGIIKKVDYNFIGSIVEILYLNNKFLIGTDTKLYIMDDLFDHNAKVRELDKADGLKGDLNANASGFYDKVSNLYYFASSTGVYVYDFKKAELKKTPIKVALDYVTIDKEKYYRNNLENITLDSSVGRITFDFSILNFSLDQNYKVYYKLEGVDQDFHELSSSDSFEIGYTNLSGGDYKFILYSIDSDNQKSSNEIELSFSKKAYVYENWWFYFIISVLAIAIIGSIFYLYFYYRMKKERSIETKLRNITVESIEAIAKTIDVKDKYTNGHSLRVGKYSKIIAEELGFTGQELDNIYYIGLLHDIGKIGIKDEILNKPSRLTDEEYKIIQSHTTNGAKILEDITVIPHIVEGAKYHHEKYDGTGYPEGLKGEEIPYIARIIACADCYDTMATARAYKEAYSKERIISEFEKGAGIHFDPNIAIVVVKLIKEDKMKFNK